MDELQYVYGAVGFVITLCVFRTICIVTDSAKEEKNARNRSNSYLEQERVLYPKDNDNGDSENRNHHHHHHHSSSIPPANRGLLHPYYNFLAGQTRSLSNSMASYSSRGAPPPYATPPHYNRLNMNDPRYFNSATNTEFEFSETGSSFRTSNQSLLPSYKTPTSSIVNRNDIV